MHWLEAVLVWGTIPTHPCFSSLPPTTGPSLRVANADQQTFQEHGSKVSTLYSPYPPALALVGAISRIVDSEMAPEGIVGRTRRPSTYRPR